AWFAVEVDATLAHLPHHFLGIVRGGAIVHHLDLHPLRAGILHENAFERLAQIGRTVVSGNHHRPERPDRPRGHRIDTPGRIGTHIGFREKRGHSWARPSASSARYCRAKPKASAITTCISR